MLSVLVFSIMLRFSFSHFVDILDIMCGGVVHKRVKQGHADTMGEVVDDWYDREKPC